MDTQLNKQIHALLNNTGLAEQKANLVFGFTQGRSDSSKDMTDAEAIDFINYLRRQPNAGGSGNQTNKMRRKIISMAHEMHWYSHGPSPLTPEGGRKIDMLRVNGWCIHYGYLHKKLSDYTYLELPKLVTQFTEMYNDYLNKI